MNRRVPSSMASAQAARLRLASLLPLLVLSACASILGIEDIQEDPDLVGGGGSSTTTNAQGGDKNGAGKGGSSPTSSTGGAGGTSDAGETSMGGEPPVGGAGNLGGDGNIAGGGNPPDPTVHGRIIDYWGRALSDVPVQIGDEQTFTDDDGRFTFENVPETYTVSFVVRPTGADYGWVYQDLTRRDPTLQVYGGRDPRETDVLVTTTGATVGVNDTITAAFGMPDGSTEAADLTPAGQHTTPDWRGSPTTTGTAHALSWTNNNATKLPSAYNAYQSKVIGLSSTMDGDISFDLTPMTITTGTVAGTVTPFSDDTRTNAAFLRFASNAHIRILEEDPAPDTFSYLVPQLPDCSITVMAREGYYAGPMGIAHRDGLNPGDSARSLDIPEPALPLKPTGGDDNVSEATSFNFRPSEDNKGAFLITLENDGYNQYLHIVTSRKLLTLPEVAGGIFTLDSNQFYRWWVETHGDYATVDEMAGPSGFMDQFSWDWENPIGPNQQDGSFTLSGRYGFTTAP